MRTTRVVACALITAAITPACAIGAQQAAVGDTTRHVTMTGFVDTYYAYDFNRPRAVDRQYTTQPARHNEFNINLAFVDASLSAPRVHARVALQTGTSVQSNYAGEPRLGSVSGPELARLIQEAFAGYQIAPTLWVDGGVFFSHLGMESWISRDNLAYSRSLVGDYSPYYQSGARLVWQATPTLAMQVDVINGWQNISETNSSKAVGARVDYTPTPSTTLSYYNFAGDEVADTVRDADGSHLRLFQGIGAKLAPTARLQLLLELDGGSQRRGHAAGDRWSSWWGYTAISRYLLTPALAVVGRVERFDDPDQVLVATGTAAGFRTNGASFGVDVTPAPNLLWRSAIRGFRASDPVFAKRTRPSHGDGFFVTSLALTL